MKSHLKALGILFVIISLIYIGTATYFIAGVSVNSGPLQEINETVTLITGFFMSSYFVILGVPGLIAGIGLIKLKNWARHLAIILSVLNLIIFPIGTVIGIYGLWVGTHGGAKALTRVYSRRLTEVA
ncbi:hypothetical protein AB9P05_09810 [Roseivirga sp. BDSF3-8]|uniref:hypothetical protein n=1 Tax=Roseivirga sp. BDSF3-8 TaxID=3241598 RepID=UPI00353269A8